MKLAFRTLSVQHKDKLGDNVSGSGEHVVGRTPWSVNPSAAACL